MAIEMTPTYVLLHGFEHKNDSMTLTLPPLQEEMHNALQWHRQRPEGCKALFVFANQKQRKDGTVYIERGDSSLIIYTVYINILDEGGEIQLDLRSQKKTEK